MHLFSLVSPVLFIAIIAILGFVTPGYSHINHTISRLAIEKYGWIQTLNFLQLAAGFVLIARRVARSMHTEASRRIIKIFFTFASSILVLAALAPTDPIDNVPFRFSLLTPTGSFHAGTVAIFLFLSPISIMSIVQALRTEPSFRKLATLTAIIGVVTFTFSLLWLIFFVLGLYLEYRGITQKILVLLVIMWIMVLNIRASQIRPSSTAHV